MNRKAAARTQTMILVVVVIVVGLGSYYAGIQMAQVPGVSQADYDALQSKFDALESEYDILKEDYEELEAAVEPPPPIKIGMAHPQTGPVAWIGEQDLWGAELAVDEINERGGVLGREIVLISEDTEGQSSLAVTAAQKMITVDKVHVLTTLLSGETLAVMPVAESNEIPHFPTAATNPVIVEGAGVGGNIWLFHPTPTDASTIAAMGQYYEMKEFKSLCVIAEDTDFGRASAESLKIGTEDLGITILSIDYRLRDVVDYTDILTKIGGLKPDAIAIFSPAVDQVANVINQARDLGIEMPFSGKMVLEAEPMKALIDAGKMEGCSVVFPYSSTYKGGRNQEFAEKFKKQYGQDATFNGYAGYQTIYTIVEAIIQAGSTDPHEIRDAAEEMEIWSILGTKLSFDDHHLMHDLVFVQEVIDGEIVTVAELPT